MLFSDLRKNLKKDFTGFTPVNIAILADSATQFLAQCLRGYGYTQKMDFRIWEADYNQIESSVFDEHSELYARKPDYVLLFLSGKKMQEKFYKLPVGARRSFADEQRDFLHSVIQRINQGLKCGIICFNFPEINDGVFGNYANKTEYSFTFQQRILNVELMKLANQTANLSICDISAIQNAAGYNAMLRESLYVTADVVFNLDILPQIAASVSAIILAYAGRIRKCLILDLDNTLWGGVIGDDGMEGIQVGSLGVGKAFTNMQLWAKQLKQRGIILAVCSKNTESIAREPFESHPEMSLSLTDFAVFVANWENKADNIRYIQSVLNIGFDSMVFVDDSPFEREQVRSQIPEIFVPDMPEDPSEYVSFLSSLNLFETVSFTEEDLSRNEQYREEAERKKAQAAFTSQDEYLESLGMTGSISPLTPFSLPRAAQLTQRSNQFNLRTVRYTEEKLLQVESEKKGKVLTISLKDRFGDYGLIGVVIGLVTEQKTLFMDTWIMSCRVLKRGVEHFTLNELVQFAKESGCEAIEGEYLPTPKNGIVKDHYASLGFQPAGDNRWRLPLEGFVNKKIFIQKEQQENGGQK